MRPTKFLFVLALLSAGPSLALAQAPTMSPGATAAHPYTVTNGYQVDAYTFQGFRAWRAASCDRCHGPNQEGLVGPSLIKSLKTLSKADFVKTVRNGRPQKGMPNWSGSPIVMTNLDNLYAYLKGRSDGAIIKARVELLK